MTGTIPRGLVSLASLTSGFAILYLVFLTVFHSSSVYEDVPAEQNAAVLAYLNDETGMPGFFDEQEAAHMADVKRLFSLSRILFLFSIGSLIGVAGIFSWFRRWRTLEELAGRTLRATGWGLLALTGFAGLAAVLNFDVFWTLFHVFLFPQGNWLFPTSSTLISLYPLSFFRAFLLSYGIRVLAVSIACVVLGHWIVRMKVHERFFRNAQKDDGNSHDR